jgi:hypothetical protein
MRSNLLTAATCFVVLGCCSMFSAQAKDPPPMSLMPEHFRDTATLKDDALDTIAIITTENGWVEHHGLINMAWNDEFLRGFVDKRTGAKTFQVYAWISYDDTHWRSYNIANFQTTTGPTSVSTTIIDRQVSSCSSYNGCHYTEHFTFDVDEKLLRAIALGYLPGAPAAWKFKFIPQSGPDFLDGLSNAEIVGFLARVDEYMTTNRITAEAAAPKPAFGVNMVPIAATADQPNRAGLLIVQVLNGSIAQKTGITIGDILTDFNGHALKQPPDLQAGVGATPPGSTVPIKLLRGVSDLTVTAQF